MYIYLEPNSLGSAVGTELVEGLRDDETSSTKHGPSSMDQLIGLISEPSPKLYKILSIYIYI